jgi:multiple sugar transport system substrate-binding protein
MSDTSKGDQGMLRLMDAARLHRRGLLGAAVLGTAGAIGLAAPPAVGQARPFAGVSISGAVFQSLFFEHLRGYIPEFEAQTGMRVDLQQQAFPVYNQRMDLELSTRGSAYDFCNLTFIYTGRWIGAGWFAPLDEFFNDPNKTQPGWDAADFMPGAQAPLQGARGETYGFCWEAGAMIMAIARPDLLDAAGVRVPTNFAELERACQAVHRREGVAAYVNDRVHHWHLIPFLMGMGGTVFRNPPDDLMPMLGTQEAAEAVEYYGRLMGQYAPSGAMSFSDDQAMRAQLSGRANIRTQAMMWMSALVTNPESRVARTVRFAPVPAGPAGAFPQANSHGLGIPAGARNKDAAWAFIRWAMSKETLARMVAEKGYPAIARRSIIDSPTFRERLTLNGQDLASLYVQVLDRTASGGYMKYRTTHVFPQVGDAINKAVERVASGQQNGRDAMRQAQEEAVAAIRRAGVRI